LWWQADLTMDAKTYLKVSIINLTFLLIGVLIGVTVAVVLVGTVHAQDDKAPKVPAKMEKTEGAIQPPSCDETRFECVTPGLSVGAAAVGVVLANRIASDKLMVNGFDPMKLHESILNTLQAKGVLAASDVQRIITSAKVDKPLRAK
jgi:hypothetical protein